MKNKKVVSIEVTDERTHDSQKSEELVEGAKEEAKKKGKRINKVLADKGYDTHRFFRYLYKEGIEAGVPVRKIAMEEGGGIWKEVACGELFSVFKRWFGEYVVSKRFVFKVGILNMLLTAVRMYMMVMGLYAELEEEGGFGRLQPIFGQSRVFLATPDKDNEISYRSPNRRPKKMRIILEHELDGIYFLKEEFEETKKAKHFEMYY